MKKIFFGILFIALAVFLILSGLGIKMSFISGLSTVDLVLSAIILIIATNALLEGHFSGIPFILMFAFFILEDDIAHIVYGAEADGNIINNWTVFGCMLLLTVGISFITSALKHKKHRHFKFSKTAGTGKSTAKSKSSNFSSDSAYIDCKDFESYSFSVKFGDGSIYFENADLYAGGGSLLVDCSFGNIDIHVPKGWHVVSHVQTHFGAFDVPSFTDVSGPTLTIEGEVKFGNIDIIYV